MSKSPDDYKKRQEMFQKKLSAERSQKWEGFEKAIGARMPPSMNGGLPSAPWGWKTPNKAAVGEALTQGLVMQLSEFNEKAVAPKSYDDYDGRRAFEDEQRVCLDLCVWAVSEACDAGAFEEAVAATRAAHQMESVADGGKLRRALTKSAAQSRGSDTPSDVERRINHLAQAAELLDKSSPWAKAAEKRSDFMDAFGRDDDRIGWLAGDVLKAAELRHGCAESAVAVIKGLVADGESSWGTVGEKAGETISRSYMRAERMPEAIFDGLPNEFWLGVKMELKGASKVGAEILRRSLVWAQTDQWVKDQVCLGVWSGLERKEIDAFEAAFPGQSAACLKRALGDNLSPGHKESRGGYELGLLLDLRLEQSAKRPSGKWGRAVVEALQAKDSAGLSKDYPQGFDMLLAQREADVLRKEVKEAKAERLAAAKAAGESVSSLKKSKARVSSL